MHTNAAPLQCLNGACARLSDFSIVSTLKKSFPGVRFLGRCYQAIGEKVRGVARIEPIEGDDVVSVHDIRKSWFTDIFIGLSIGAMSVPQGMSYANLARVPFESGLYNNMLFPLIYFLLGSCRHAITGVAAVESLMIGDTIDNLVGHDATPAERLNWGMALALFSGIIFFIFRLCHLGVIGELLADPVLEGFSTASFFLVAASQMKNALAIKGVKSEWGFPMTITYTLKHLGETHLPTLTTCAIGVVFLSLCKRVSKRFFHVPGPFLLVVFGCLISYYTNLTKKFGIKVIGEIPHGLPSFDVPPIPWTHRSSVSADALWKSRNVVVDADVFYNNRVPKTHVSHVHDSYLRSQNYCYPQALQCERHMRPSSLNFSLTVFLYDSTQIA